jgi:hypothetical protein
MCWSCPDRDGDPPGRDRHRVDVPSTLPRQRKPQPPPSARSGASARCTSSSEQAPTWLRPASASQRRAERPSPNAMRNSSPASGADPAPPTTDTRGAPRRRSPRPSQRARDACTAADARTSTVVLARWRIDRWFGWRAQLTFRLGHRAVSHPGCFPGASKVAWRIASRAVVACFQSRGPRRRATHPHCHRLPARCERHCWRTTSTGPLGVLTVIGSERFATALPANGQCPFRAARRPHPHTHRTASARFRSRVAILPPAEAAPAPRPPPAFRRSIDPAYEIRPVRPIPQGTPISPSRQSWRPAPASQHRPSRRARQEARPPRRRADRRTRRDRQHRLRPRASESGQTADS